MRSPSDGPTPGRLTQDVDPPGFESLASLIPGTDTTERHDELTRVTRLQETGTAATKTGQRASPAGDVQKVRRAEETRRARAAAKVTLQEAKRSLTQARSRAQRLEAEQKNAYAEAKEADAEPRQAEKQLREAEERFKKAPLRKCVTSRPTHRGRDTRGCTGCGRRQAHHRKSIQRARVIA